MLTCDTSTDKHLLGIRLQLVEDLYRYPPTCATMFIYVSPCALSTLTHSSPFTDLLCPQFWSCVAERPAASTHGRLSKKKTSSQLRISGRGRVTQHDLNVHLSSKLHLLLLWLYIMLKDTVCMCKSHFLLKARADQSFHVQLNLTDKWNIEPCQYINIKLLHSYTQYWY